MCFSQHLSIESALANVVSDILLASNCEYASVLVLLNTAFDTLIFILNFILNVHYILN